MNRLKTLSKKELKDHVNSRGGFFFSDVEVDKNIPEKIAKIVRESGRYTKEQQNAILEHGTYFKGISSNGDLNRNGYKIRSNAWKPAVKDYLESNPAVLLQHNSDSIIGHTLTARVSQDQLISEGIIFKDQMPEATALAFERGQLKALSTGHYTKEIEWENSETGEILTTEEFRKLSWEERMEDLWIMAVTALEWVEQSLVAIGSNRDSMITTKNAKLNYFENTLGENITDEMKNSMDDDEPEVIEEAPEEVVEEALEEVPEEETEAVPAEKEEENKETETVENPEEPEAENAEDEPKEGDEEEAENTSTESISELLKVDSEVIKEKLSIEQEEEEPAEKAETPTPEKLTIRMDHLMEDLEANGLGEVKELFETLSAMIKEKNVQINSLLTAIENVPKYKGLAIASQFGEMIQEKKDQKKNDLGTDGSSILKAFENSGLRSELGR